MTEANLISEYESNYLYARDYWSPFVTDAQTYTLAASGYTWTNTEREELSKEGREPIEFNIIRRALEFFSGYLRDNLKSVVISPVEGSDQQTATQFTKLQYDVWNRGSGYNMFLSACDEMFKSGISLCGLQMDYSKDFINGDVSFYRRTFNSFYLDPTFEHLDLSDCGFAITRDLINPDQAKMLLANIVDPKVIDEVPGTFRDEKFINFHPNFTNVSKAAKIIAYDHYYRRTTRTREYLVDLKTGFFRDITDLDKEEKNRLKTGIKRLRELNEDRELLGLQDDEVPAVEIRKIERPFVELNIMLNGMPVYRGEDDTGICETFPFRPLVCYFEPSIWMASQRIQGIGSTQYWNQRQFNKRHMKIIDMMDSVISTGYKYLIGSVADPEDLQQSGQSKLIGIDPDNAPEGMNSVQELQGGNVNPAIIEYQRILDDLSLTLANVNESVLGVDDGGNTQISGRLAQVRIAQGLRSNRKVFDNIEYTQQQLGGLVMQVLQNKYPSEKIERILGEQPTEQFYNKEFEQYDAQIKEGVRSKSQKDAFYYELVNLKRDGIVDVPQSLIIEQLDVAGIEELKEAIKMQDQAAQEQKKQLDEQERVALELANSQKISNLSLAKEREARIMSDIGLAEERHSEASSNLADASLARAKAIVEISKLEDERIMQLMTFVQQMRDQEVLEQEKVSQETERKAAIVDQKEELRQKIDEEKIQQKGNQQNPLLNNPQ